MKSSTQILSSFLRGVRFLFDSAAAAVFVPPPSDGSLEPILVHDGDRDALHEFRSVEAAQSTVEQLMAGGRVADRRPAGDSGGVWILPMVSAPPKPADPPTTSRRAADNDPARRPRAYLAVHIDSGSGQVDDAGTSDPRWQWVREFGADLAEQAIRVHSTLRDPVTGLADRIGFQALLSDQVERATQAGTWLSLVLINPHNFGQVNERFGRFSGDKVLREVAELICDTLRESDPVSRYGGAIFGALLPATPPEDATTVAHKLVHTVRDSTFLDGDVRLELCCGVASLDPGDQPLGDPLDLLRRADLALNRARREGEGAVDVWGKAGGEAEEGRVESGRISELFSGDLARDYRNMALLRDAVDLVADTHDLETLAGAVVERLYSACKAERVGLFRRADGQPQLVRGIARPSTPVGARRETFELEPAPAALLASAMEQASVQSRPVEIGDGRTHLAFAVPIVAGGEAIGGFYIDGAVESIDVDATDLIFFKALSSQLSIALERAQLESSRSSSRLEEELLELRTAVQESQLVHTSESMAQLLDAVDRVGPTEATILITGESGTGKEMIARRLHESSARRRRGLTVVDCAAIAPTLIDSELFGHDQGAYTGAQRRRSGRLAEADGGTVLLDEVGELPVEVQSRLLRFVQEKQITLVGESRPRKIDVRILAATNRDLEEEARAGRFREDLYHRLNVVRLDVPPLRDRPDDVVFLAEHFLSQFCDQYGKVGAHLTADAREALVRYDWPGNVRELQNRMLQAVILLEGRALAAASLGLPSEPAPRVVQRSRPEKAPRAGATVEEALDELRLILRGQIEAIVDRSRAVHLPLGKWLAEDLLAEADLAEGGTARRAAQRIGLAETTYRRRLAQAQARERAGLAPRPDGWLDVREALTRLLHASDRDGKPLLKLAEAALLDEIVSQLEGDEVTGAALLGVTLPTYRRRIESWLDSAGT